MKMIFLLIMFKILSIESSKTLLTLCCKGFITPHRLIHGFIIRV